MLPTVANFFRSHIDDDYDPRDADSGPHEALPTSTYQDPDTLNQQPLPPQQPEYAPITPPTYTIQDGRTTPPTPNGDWQPVRTIPRPQPVAQDPPNPYGAPRDAAADINGNTPPDYGDGGAARREAQTDRERRGIGNYQPVTSSAGEPDYVAPRYRPLEVADVPRVAGQAVSAARDAAQSEWQNITNPQEGIVSRATGINPVALSIAGRLLGPGVMMPGSQEVANVVMAAINQFGDSVGRRVAQALGVPDGEFVRIKAGTVPGVKDDIVLTNEDVAGLVGSTLLDPTNLLGAGEAKPAARAVGRAGRELAAEAPQAAREAGQAAGRAGYALAEEGARQLMDLTPSPGMMGAAESGGGSQRAERLTVEVLRERMDKLRGLRDDARASRDADLEADATRLLQQYDGELADALNARKDLEPRITSDVGRRLETLPQTEARAERTLTQDAMTGTSGNPARPDELSGPMGVPTDMTNRANAFSPGAALAGGAAGGDVDEDGNPIVDPYRAGAGMAVAGIMGRKGKPSPTISKLGQRVMDTYAKVTPQRVEASTARALQIASDAIAGKIPKRGGMDIVPSQIVRDTHAAIVRNLQDTKTVMTGLRPGALAAYMRGEGLTSKVDTRDLDQINRITQGQVNVAGGRAQIVDGKPTKVPYTLEEAGHFVTREAEQMRVATGGTRIPDANGVIDEEAPRVMYAYVSEGQPLVGPNRPTMWLAWNDDTPRITSANHPFGLTSPGQSIHEGMPPGVKAAIWAEDAIKGGVVDPARPGPGGQPIVRDWERKGIPVGRGRKIADTNWLVGPEGEDAMRANGLILSMPQEIQQQIARGAMTDPEQIAAVLMRGGAPQWKSGWASAVSAQRSESLILDPNIANVKAIYLTATPKNLATNVPNTGMGRGKGATKALTEQQMAEKIRADILEQTGRDVPIYLTDISQAGKPTAMADAKLLAGTPLETPLAPGRQRIVDQYTQAIDPATKKPYTNLGGFAPGGAIGAGAGTEVDENGNPVGVDPWRALTGAFIGSIIGRKGMNAAERDAWVKATKAAAARGSAKAAEELAKVERAAAQQGLPGFEAIDPLTDARSAVAAIPENRAILPGNSLNTPREIVDNVIRQEQQQATLLARRASQKPESAVQPGQMGLLPPENPGVLSRIGHAVKEAVAPWERRLDIVRYAGVLSDTAAHVINAAGGATMQGVDVLSGPIAATADAARSRLTGRPREVFFSETPARLAGMRAGWSIGLENAREVLRTGLSAADAAKQLDRESAGFASGNKIVDFAFEAPLRALAAADAVFRTTAQGGHLAAEGMAAAMKANPGVQIAPDMLREAMKNPDVVKRAGELASRTVLQEDRAVTRWWRHDVLGKAPPGVKTALSMEFMFTKTPYNIVAQGVGLTPAGLLGVIQDMAQHKPAREIEFRVARAALGTAVMGAALADYSAGNLIGPRPTDEKEASTWPPGQIPWSRKVTVGGQTYYVPLAVLGPLAVPPVAAILLAESAKKGGDMQAKAARVALGVGQYAAQNTFLEGITETGKLFDPRGNVGSNVQRHAESIAAQFSPHIVGGGSLGREIQQIMGMPARDPDGMLEALLATHPATAGMVEPAQDVLGRPRVPNAGGPLRVVARVGQQKDAGVIRAFRSAKEGLPMAAPKQITDPVTKEQQSLTPKQQHRWRRAFGSALSEGWDSRGGPDDADSLKKIEAEARKTANEIILGIR